MDGAVLGCFRVLLGVTGHFVGVLGFLLLFQLYFRVLQMFGVFQCVLGCC